VIPDNGGNSGNGTAGLFESGQGCGGESTEIENETSALSHEFAETTNDPEIGLLPASDATGAPIAWYDNNNGEVADICDTGSASEDTEYAGTWFVQNLWSNRDGKCEATQSDFTVPSAGTINPPATVAAGQSASFSTTGASDSSSDSTGINSSTYGPGIASYDWSWGDGSSDSTGAAPQHEYAESGQYTVTLTVTDDLGFIGTTTADIQVYTGIPDVTTSTPATGIDDTSATLAGTINPYGADTSYQFDYGLSPDDLSQSTTTTDGGSGTSSEDLSAALSGLTPGTTYYYELVGTVNSVAYDGGVQSFMTTGTKPATATTTPATTVDDTGATLNGILNPAGVDTTFSFIYGFSAGALNHATTVTDGGSGISLEDVDATLSNLPPGTTYYYEIVGTADSTAHDGGVQTFTTTGTKPMPAVITTAATGVGTTGGTLNGTINPDGVDTTYKFIYGTSPSALNQSTTVTDGGSGANTDAVTAVLSNLTPGTPYYYELVGTANIVDYDGGVQVMTTKTPPEQIVSTGSATAVTDAAATLNGTINPDGLAVTYQFAWGTSPSALVHVTTSSAGPTGTNSVPVSAPLSGLSAATTYYYELDSTSAGHTVTGAMWSFKTLPPPAAGVSTGKASPVSSKSATLHGAVIPRGFAARYYFQWGKTTKYGHMTRATSAGSGAGSVSVSARLTGLKPKTKYHYRLVVRGPGGTVDGSDKAFTTPRQKKSPDLSFTVRAGRRLSHGIRVSYSCNEACSVGFTARRPSSAFIAVAGTPISIATGNGSLRRAGAGTLLLHLTSPGRVLARNKHVLRLVIVGAASNEPGSTAATKRRSVRVR
jgi:phosphodiesterase/alkaline phosphatase D-like protein